MKLMRIFPFLALIVFWSCQDQKEEAEQEEVVVEEEVVNPDELVAQWKDAWSSNEPQNVKDMMADDVVLVLNGSQFPKDSIAPWTDAAGSSMKDLQMKALQKGHSNTIVFESGTFSHGARENDTLSFRGTYTFIWEKPEAGDEWKVTVMDISDEDNMEQPKED